jgi:hypothetical protein
MNSHVVTRLLALVMTIVVLAGCSEPEPNLRPMTVAGTVAAPEGVSGPVEIWLYHEWSLEGDLRHPLQFIDTFKSSLGPFEHSFDYPEDIGEGLVVYAWVDTDGDGVNCTPEVRNDLAGLTVAEDAEQDRVEVDVLVGEPCRGPDFFYPPVPSR